MKFNRIRRSSAFALLALALAACSQMPEKPPAAAVLALAPIGVLRVGVYEGSPTSLVRKPGSAEPVGLAYDLGQALGQELGVPVHLVEFARAAQVADALKSGSIDVTFTNASPERAREIDFTPALVQLELGYLVAPQSPIRSIAQIDQPRVRVGVLKGSTSQATLTKLYTQASVVPVEALKDVKGLMAAGTIDAYATNKSVLFELADGMPGYRVLDGNWGAEHLAVAVPKGREAGRAVLEQFARKLRDSGLLLRSMQRAGLRGAQTAP